MSARVRASLFLVLARVFARIGGALAAPAPLALLFQVSGRKRRD
jgi:hypothetical protein